MDVADKLEILADAAKYDVACTSSGIDRSAQKGCLGSTVAAGCCHSWTPDGRCISLLKVLMTNVCEYDCAYCVNRISNDHVRRTAFTPQELADLTMGMYRRNYIEGLFLSSAVLKTPDYTCERMIETFRILRDSYHFCGYIHAKIIPGTSPDLIDKIGRYADRVSVNLEMPSQQSLKLLAPSKTKTSVLGPMKYIHQEIDIDKTKRLAAHNSRSTLYVSKRGSKSMAPSRKRAFAPAGQSTQMIIGASPESDYQILNISSALYKQYKLKRVFFSAYIPVVKDPRLPQSAHIQLDREHRLFQADWLMRFYGFDVNEIVDANHPFLDTQLDPKAQWAIHHLDLFPIEINTASYQMLLRVPGIGVRGAQRIIKARKTRRLSSDDVARIGIAYKRARYFITCCGNYVAGGIDFSSETLRSILSAPIDGGHHGRRAARPIPGQQSLFDDAASPISVNPVKSQKELPQTPRTSLTLPNNSESRHAERR